jgi:metal-responsive CopG/Arc/MetJ family transcriptional regulator
MERTGMRQVTATKEKGTIGVYIDFDLINRIDSLARNNGRSRNRMITELVNFSVDLYEENADIERSMDNAMDRIIEDSFWEMEEQRISNQ